MKYNFINSHSKSSFEIIKNKKSLLIKKYPKKIDLRELSSVNKQNNFKNYIIENYLIKSSKIISKIPEIKKNKFYLLKYYSGKSGSDLLQYGNYEEISILKKFFYNYFNANLNNKNFYYLDKDIILSKIDSIKKDIKIKEIKIIAKKIISKVQKKINKNILYPLSNTCHGDLTLGNIIINSKNKKIILIDFQKTYHDNIVQDLSKVFQDFKLNWTSRSFSSLDKVRSRIIYNSMINDSFWNDLNKKIKKSLNQEILITLLRIFPYLKKEDKISIQWLISSFNKLI
jgi:hypothetical protein